MPLVEDRAGVGVLLLVGRARLLVASEGRFDLGRELGPEPVRLRDEVRERRGGVGEHERPQAVRVRQRVLLREEAAPRLAEHVVALSQPERVDEVVQLAHEEIDRPEVGAALRVVRAAPVAELVVVDDGAAAVGKVRDREQVVVRARPARRGGRSAAVGAGIVGAQVAGDAIPGLGRLVADVERNRALVWSPRGEPSCVRG